MSTEALVAPSMDKSLGNILGGVIVLALLLYGGLPLYPFGGLAIATLVIGGLLMSRANRPAFGVAGAYASVSLAGIGLILTTVLH